MSAAISGGDAGVIPDIAALIRATRWWAYETIRTGMTLTSEEQAELDRYRAAAAMPVQGLVNGDVEFNSAISVTVPS